MRAYEERAKTPSDPHKFLKNTIELPPSSAKSQGGLKRKRTLLDGDLDSHSDDQETLQLRRSLLKPPVRRKKAKEDGVKRCSRCDRVAFTSGNILVTCRHCEEHWHQQCNAPHIQDAAADDPSKFKCMGCFAEEEEMARYREAKSEMTNIKRHHDIAKLRRRRMESLPLAVFFKRPEAVGFAAGASSEALVSTPSRAS
jgi:hypothetical protein